MSRVPGFGDLVRAAAGAPSAPGDPSISLDRIVEAFVEQDWDALTEASLGRIYQHHKNSGHKSFAILTSHRSSKSPAENKSSFSELQGNVRKQGYGYNKMSGVGEEEGGTASVEPSLFVHGMSLKHAVEHGKKHDQHSVIYSGPETKGHVHLVHLKDDGDKKVGDHTDLGTFHPKKIGQYYSKIRNKSFTFAEGDEGPIKAWCYSGENVGESEWMMLRIQKRLEEKQEQ